MEVGSRVRVVACPQIYRWSAPLIGNLGTVTYVYPVSPMSSPDGLVRVRLDGRREFGFFPKEIEEIGVGMITIKCHLCGELFTAKIPQEEMDGYTLNDDSTYNGADVEHCCYSCADEDEHQVTKDWQHR